MYLIFLLPTEINDDILIHLERFSLAIKCKRFWAASKLYHHHTSEVEYTIRENDLVNMIPFFTVEEKNNEIKYSSRYGNFEIVKLLLEDPRIDPSHGSGFFDYDTAFYWASRNGHDNVVQLLLLDPRIDPSVDNNCAIRYASYYGHDKVVRLLLADPRIDPSDENNNAICLASFYGNFEGSQTSSHRSSSRSIR